jgi:tetratricopeptide (TPR) repeat protein
LIYQQLLHNFLTGSRQSVGAAAGSRLFAMKIAIYAICLNEIAHIDRCLSSAVDADLISVADTGSSDGSVEAIAAHGARVYPIQISPWRFDDARNASLALLPTDIDLCLCLDIDVVLRPGWRGILEAAWSPGVNMVYYDQIFGRRADGGEIRFTDNRIHARHGLRWKAPCHEYLVFDRTEERSVRIVDVLIEHQPDLAKSRAQYLPLLALGAREAPHDGRASHYLARELRTAGHLAEAAAEFERYLGLEPSNPEERSMSLRLLGMIRLTQGDPGAAIDRFRQAAREAPHLPGAWLDLACALYQVADWAPCLDACVRAIEAGEPTFEYGSGSESGAIPEDLASVSAWRLGRRTQAVDFARRAVARAPAVERLRSNLVAMEASLTSPP